MINMKNRILYPMTICLCGCMSMFGQTDFEYRIVSNLVDSTMNGCEISLTNDSDWITEDFGVVKNGIIDIKSKSNLPHMAFNRAGDYR